MSSEAAPAPGPGAAGWAKHVSLVVMGLFYALAGLNHFRDPGFYTQLMPAFLPAPMALIYLSGVAEVLLAALLLIPRTRKAAAWAIIAMLVVFMLVHVPMAVSPEDFPDFPVWGLYLRIPLQGVFIAWAWWHTR